MKFIILALIPLILSIGIIPAMFLDANADYIDKFSFPYVLEPLTNSQIDTCDFIHDDFTLLLDSDFYNRYQTHDFIGNCIMLYDDSIWDYDGSDRYEILSEKSVILTLEREEKLKQNRENFYIDSTSLIELQIPGTFLFKFEGCTGDQTISLNDVSVVSDKETVLLTKFVGEQREIPSGVCNNLEIQIRADDPNSIKVVITSLDLEIFANLDAQIIHKSPRDQIRSGAAPTEVICMDGLELLLKTSDGSPACVKESTANKLIERGWGKLV